MKKLMVVSSLLVLLLVAALAAAQPWQGWKGSGGWGMQGGYHRMYDPSKAETVSGEVVSVEQVMPMKRMGAGIGL
ncbi:MAG TPA: DNA-binding protein, partial [Nitrospirota bacterium]|nr:DNA-binding protein [Nitrospirota bacterium]